MRRLELVAITALLLVSCGGGSPSGPSASTAAPVAVATPAPPRVVIMSIDGFRPDAMQKVGMPNIADLASRGSYTFGAQTINPSNTLPSHTSMLTGVQPSVHKITWDDYLPAKGKLTSPTLFNVAKTAGLRTAMVVGKDKFVTIQEQGGVDAFVLSMQGDDDVANQAIVQLGGGYNLLFIHFPDVDLTGHEKKWLSTQYLDRLARVDAAVGRILMAVPPQTTIILTADHGGSDYGHGTTMAVHMTIPWIIQGPKIRAGNVLTVPVNTTDTAATAAYALGLRMPVSVTGRAVTEAFTAPAANAPTAAH